MRIFYPLDHLLFLLAPNLHSRTFVLFRVSRITQEQMFVNEDLKFFQTNVWILCLHINFTCVTMV